MVNTTLDQGAIDEAPELDDLPISTDARAGAVSIALLIKRALASDNPAILLRDQDLIKALASLAPGEYGACKAELKEHFGRRLPMRDLERAVKESKRQNADTARNKQKKQGSAARPMIDIDAHLRDLVKLALDALALTNQETPRLFVMSGQLVTIHYSEKAEPSIAPVSLSRVRYFMSQSADYVKTHTDADGEPFHTIVDPPLDVARVLIEGMNPAEYPFPALAGITELPILRPDGSIHAAPGYDAITQQVYIPGDLVVPPIPDKPSEQDIKKALALLSFWLGDFPFVSEADRAAILANAITVVIRAVIDGQVPLTLLDAPKQGTGKSLIAQAIGILATGRKISPNSPTPDEAEMKKLIITWLLSSPAVVLIDNVFHMLESSSLSSALTSSSVGDRLLSTNTYVSAPNRAVWFATGNNIRVGADLARRCIKCRLDARMERPHKRDVTAFRIPGGTGGYENWTIEHRAELIAAILTLARFWYLQGKPAPDLTPLGNFENWTLTVGGILQIAGVPGFLANLDDEDGNSAIDEETAEWANFIEMIYTVYGSTPFTCSDLARFMIGESEQAEPLREALPTAVTKNLSAYRKSQGQDSEFPSHLGNAMRKRKGQVFGKLRLEDGGKNRQNKVQWRVFDQDAPARKIVTVEI